MTGSAKCEICGVRLGVPVYVDQIFNNFPFRYVRVTCGKSDEAHDQDLAKRHCITSPRELADLLARLGSTVCLHPYDAAFALCPWLNERTWS